MLVSSYTITPFTLKKLKVNEDITTNKLKP